MDGGAVVEKGSVLPHHSQVRVEDLFFNVPAHEILKSDSTENRQITGLLTQYAWHIRIFVGA